jgi:hypothetical protein
MLHVAALQQTYHLSKLSILFYDYLRFRDSYRIIGADAAGRMEQLVRAEGGGEGEGIFQAGAENRTGTVVQKHETIKCRHTHGKQNNHNAHIHTKLAGNRKWCL